MKTKNKIPMRQCTGCREMKSKKEMIRVLKTPEDEIVLDTTGRKNGRGAYVCPSTECLDKAGKVASGEFSTEKSVKTGKGFLVLVADDASQNTRKKFQNMCDFYEVPIYFIANKEELGRFCGKEFRASLAVQDENFAKSMLKELHKL